MCGVCYVHGSSKTTDTNVSYWFPRNLNSFSMISCWFPAQPKIVDKCSVTFGYVVVFWGLYSSNENSQIHMVPTRSQLN